MSNASSLELLRGQARSNRVRHTDRIGVTLFFALAFHAVLILGISFDLVDEDALYSALSLDVTLVSSRSEDTPDDASYLAQDNQLGGGNTQEKVQPGSPFSNPNPSTENSFAPNVNQEMSPPEQQQEKAKLETLNVARSKNKVISETQIDPLPLDSNKKKLGLKLPTSSTIKQLTDRINNEKNRYSKSQDSLHSGVDAEKYQNANYDVQWQSKIEKIGNFNYPTAAIRNNITGTLSLDVAITADGSLYEINILKSSGHKVLDTAAIKIVTMAAPFAPLSDEIKANTEIYHIVRVWRFRNGKSLF